MTYEDMIVLCLGILLMMVSTIGFRIERLIELMEEK